MFILFLLLLYCIIYKTIFQKWYAGAWFPMLEITSGSIFRTLRYGGKISGQTKCCPSRRWMVFYRKSTEKQVYRKNHITWCHYHFRHDVCQFYQRHFNSRVCIRFLLSNRFNILQRKKRKKENPATIYN